MALLNPKDGVGTLFFIKILEYVKNVCHLRHSWVFDKLRVASKTKIYLNSFKIYPTVRIP